MNSVSTNIFVSCLTGILLTSSFLYAQQKHLQRVGYLSALSPTAESDRSRIILQALREFGYVEGQNIAIEYRYSEGNPDRAAGFAADLVRLKVDMILVAGGDRWIVAARKATQTIPIVMTGGGLDPVAAGHAQSLARPGGNVTGLTILNTELSGKRLELLREAVPKLARVAVVCDSTIPSNVREQKDVQSAAAALGLAVRSWTARDLAGIEQAFAAIGKERPDAIYICQGGILNNNRKLIADKTLKAQLPSIYSNIESVAAGGLMYYGTERAESYRRVAWYVDKILKGTKPTDLPIEQPTKFELVINLKTAKQIGVTIPPNVLARADRVIR